MYERQKGVCFTGKLQHMSRNDAKSLAQKAGFKICDDVTYECDYLVMADPNSNSSKAKKARKKADVSVISEDEFLKMVDVTAEEADKIVADKKAAEKKCSKSWQQCLKKICKNLGLQVSITSGEYSLTENRYVTFKAKVWLDDEDKEQTQPLGVDGYYWRDIPNVMVDYSTASGYRNAKSSSSKEEAAYRLVKWLFEGLPHVLEDEKEQVFHGYFGKYYLDPEQIKDPNSRINRIKALGSKIPSMEVNSIEELELALECYGWNMVTD